MQQVESPSAGQRTQAWGIPHWQDFPNPVTIHPFLYAVTLHITTIEIVEKAIAPMLTSQSCVINKTFTVCILFYFSQVPCWLSEKGTLFLCLQTPRCCSNRVMCSCMVQHFWQLLMSTPHEGQHWFVETDSFNMTHWLTDFGNRVSQNGFVTEHVSIETPHDEN